MSELDNFIPLVIIQCIRLSGSGKVDSECISQNRSGERMHQLLSRNAVGKHDVQVRQLHTLLDRIQCICLSGSGEMDSVSVKTGWARGCTDPQVRM